MKDHARISLGKRILRDAALGVGIIALAVMIFLFRVYTGIDVGIRWVELAVFTALIFGYAVWAYRRYWGRVKFWIALAALLAIHLLAFTIVLQEYPEWRPVWFVGTTCIESLPIIFILDKAVGGASRGL